MGIILFSYSPKLLPAGYDDNIVSQPQSATSASPKRYVTTLPPKMDKLILFLYF